MPTPAMDFKEEADKTTVSEKSIGHNK